MKNSLRKLRGFGLHKQAYAKDRRDPRHLAQLDELAQASEDLQNMRDCYDTLFSAAAATANSAYEFSESLQDMGVCLLEKTALNDDEDSGKVLLKLGKVQFELQKLVDSYRSHIFKTITTPSQSLLNELRTVEEMKQQCDEKRNVYEHMVSQREKGRSKVGKGETFSKEQLQAAHDEYDEEATLFIFRLKSLKQGLSRSLLTQAARHHAAQLCFFKKALKSLEAVEPHVKTITEQHHIDYQFSGLEDDDGEDADDNDYFDTRDEGELSFDYGEKGQEIDVVSTSQDAMELDQADITFPTVGPVMTAKENLQRSCWESHSFRTEIRTSSQSAPLFAENKSDKRKPIRLSSSRRFSTYVLPTPGGTKSPSNTGSDSPLSQTLRTSESARTHSLWHSSPLDGKKLDKILEEERLSKSITQSGLRESNSNISATGLPPPLADGLLISRLDPHGASDSKKIKRQAFSGPLTSKPWPTKPFSKEHSRLFSVPIQRPRSSSPKVSPCPSPPLMSSPKISELHELPRPPASPSLKSSRPIGYVGHSAPLLPRCQFQTTRNESAKRRTSASPLPTPPQAITRSFSIPSSNNLNEVVETSKAMETSPSYALVSPPLTPISLRKPSRGSTTVQIVEIRDTD